MGWEVTTKEMHRMATEEFMTLREIAGICGISKQAVSARFKRAGLKLTYAPFRGRDNLIITTKNLLEEHLAKFTHYYKVAKNLGITPQILSRWLKYHGIGWKYNYHGKNAGNYKGGRFTDYRGYVWLNCFENKYMDFNSEWRLHNVHEHKFLMETKVLGCKLPKNSVVHHLDEARDNNGMENLSLLTLGQHMTVHATLREISTATEGEPKWRVTLLEYFNKMVVALSQSNIYRIRIMGVLKSSGSLDELATITLLRSKSKSKRELTVEHILDSIQ